MSDGDLVPRRGGIAPEKIHCQHRDRLAIVYVRQSTVQQVERHQESTRRGGVPTQLDCPQAIPPKDLN